MTRFSDEEIIEHILGSMWNSERATGVKDTFVKQCVIMSYRLAEEKLQGEIEKLKLQYDIAIDASTAKTLTIEHLTAIHKKLIDGLKDLRLFDATIMETDGHSATFNTAVVFHAEQIQRLLTEEGNV